MKHLTSLIMAAIIVWLFASWAEIIACQGTSRMLSDINLLSIVLKAWGVM